jgi:hypothetical protein
MLLLNNHNKVFLMWKFTKIGKEKVQNVMIGEDDRSCHHTNDEIFHVDVFGLTLTQHIDMKQAHAVMLVEGKLWDSDGISTHGKSAKQIADEGTEAFKKEGIYNLFAFHPELLKKEYIDNLEQCPMLHDNDMRGISVVTSDGIFDFLGKQKSSN